MPEDLNKFANPYDGVACPRCGQAFHFTAGEQWENDGDEFEVECEDCEIDMTVVVNITVDYDCLKVTPWPVTENAS